MALRDQPYLPLYVQDFLTDEKLIECSASATGIYIRLMCVMHKSDEYGTVLLKQKDKQNTKQIINFACKLAKFLPYQISEIESGLSELLAENVLKIEGDSLIQGRMVKDNKISLIRSESGKLGGKNSLGIKGKIKLDKPKKIAQAKNQANTENENEYVNEIDNENKNGIETGNKKPPNPEYANCIKIYDDFIKLRTSAPARIDGLVGRSMNEIIIQLSKYEAVVGKKKTVTELLQYIFDHFNDWTTFQQTQIKLNQINSNLENIINSIKNGRPKSGKNAGADEIHQLAELQRRGVKIDYASMFDKKSS